MPVIESSMMNATSTASISGGSPFALLATVVILAIIAFGSLFLISNIENYLKMHRFIRNIFTNIFVAVKYSLFGFAEIAAAYGLYIALRALAAQPTISGADPVLIAQGILGMVICFFLGLGTDRAIKRYHEIRAKAESEAAMVEPILATTT